MPKKTQPEPPEDPVFIHGYRAEDLARVATLMERCDVKPEEIKELSQNIAKTYGVIMRGIKKDIKVSSDAVIMELRYPGIRDFLRMIEEIEV